MDPLLGENRYLDRVKIYGRTPAGDRFSESDRIRRPASLRGTNKASAHWRLITGASFRDHLESERISRYCEEGPGNAQRTRSTLLGVLRIVPRLLY
jgi:hypothetical protein